MSQVTLALDAMGGDEGSHVIVPAAIAALQRHSTLHIVLVGDSAAIQAELTAAAQGTAHDDDVSSRIRVQHASQVVEMDETPSSALRGKKDSSMRVAINLVRDAQAQACVSAGNTGALMATAKFVLKTLPGVDRPAICASIPAEHGHTHVLDLGANVDCSAEQLQQFAVMGAQLVSALDGVPAPRVGLLNIGEEAIKGNERVREASALLSQSDINYVGFVEANEIFTDRADVVVCDGFVGNVLLKTTEGAAKMFGQYLREAFLGRWFGKLAALIAMPVLKRFRHRIDPRRYNGASFLGLRGIVVKSHGSADKLAFGNAIDIAVIEVANNVPQRIQDGVERNLQRTSAPPS